MFFFLLVATCQLTFRSIVLYTGTDDIYSSSIVVSDLNGDDYQDIVVANGNGNIVGVLLGIGDGTFETQMSLLTGGSFPLSVAVGDFNSDNYYDLAVANSNYALFLADNVAVLLGYGDGNFQVPMIFPIGFNKYPKWIAVGDYNNDNYLDVAVANSYSNDISVLIGNNDGTFTRQMTYCNNTCDSFSSITSGDFNGDGQLDLAVSSDYANTVHILLNTGNGYFAESMMFSTGSFSSPESLTVNDFNNDNRLDLAFVNSVTNNLVIMFGDGNGQFGAQMVYSTGALSSPASLVVCDFNNDGQLDVAVTNSGMNNVGIFFGIENGSFLAQTTFSTGVGSVPTVIAAGDFNRDGKMDIAIIDGQNDGVSVLLNTCDCC